MIISIKMKESILTTSDVVKNIVLCFNFKYRQLKRNDVREIVLEVETVLSENKLIYTKYVSENYNQTRESKTD
ncbi:hypothetical protein AB8B23_02560 [Leptotrichia sp. HSP-342]|uniref:Uncharacterized protein n=1 Tax=Leptotrichia mesophila TaxID=3239303 RepID=A0AB39VB38_9FUSO